MAYDFSTICAIAKALGFPDVDDERVQALLCEGHKRRWRKAKYEERYIEIIQDALALSLTWKDYEEAAIVNLVQLRERAYEKLHSQKIAARNRVIEMLKREQYDAAEQHIGRIKELRETLSLISIDIINLKSAYPNADWNF
jgi:hypothetical protein